MVARITLPGDTSQIAARLVDVSPDGTTKTLVERGLWRPTNQGLQVFQLFANGWKVEEGHVLRLELLPPCRAGRATSSRVYGSAIMRLRSLTATSDSAVYATGAVEYGFCAATALNGAKRRPISRA